MTDLISKSALVDRLSEEAKRLAEIAMHSKGQAVDYYTGMKTGMARAAIWANGTPTGAPTVDAEWMLKHGMIQDADFHAIDAVPVVRCKECKYYQKSVLLSPAMMCFRLKDRDGKAIGYNFADDDFCSYGERSEE